MRVEGRSIEAGGARRPETGRGAAAGFPELRPPAAGSSGRSVAAAPVAAAGLFLAVQDLPDATERRRRAVRHGWTLLDRLDDVHLALLDGAPPLAALRRLRLERALPAPPADEVGLALLLAAIDVRIAVELAKLERAVPAETAAG